MPQQTKNQNLLHPNFAPFLDFIVKWQKFLHTVKIPLMHWWYLTKCHQFHPLLRNFRPNLRENKTCAAVVFLAPFRFDLLEVFPVCTLPVAFSHSYKERERVLSKLQKHVNNIQESIYSRPGSRVLCHFQLLCWIFSKFGAEIKYIDTCLIPQQQNLQYQTPNNAKFRRNKNCKNGSFFF